MPHSCSTPPTPAPFRRPYQALTPAPGAPGFFNGPGDFKGDLTATRFGNTWLVVAGGSGLAQRIEVLRHLTPTVGGVGPLTIGGHRSG